jgi:hypothetical protein
MEPTEPIMQFFAYAHLPPHLQEISQPFGSLANLIVQTLSRNPERSTALRKLSCSRNSTDTLPTPLARSSVLTPPRSAPVPGLLFSGESWLS